LAQEIDAVHHRHVPVQQHGVRHGGATPGEGFHSVGGLGDLETYVFQDAPGDFTDHPAVVDDEAGLHGTLQILADGCRPPGVKEP